MDDIEPGDSGSPQIIHVVGYSEAVRLADPQVVEESIRITRYALSEYRRLKRAGQMADMTSDGEVGYRTQKLLADARAVIGAIERSIERPYSAPGLYAVMKEGFLALPRLHACRDEFEKAVAWKTRLVSGGVAVVDELGAPVDPGARADAIADRILEGACLVFILHHPGRHAPRRARGLSPPLRRPGR